MATGSRTLKLLHSRENDRRAVLYAFSLLKLDVAGSRERPLKQRKEYLGNS